MENKLSSKLKSFIFDELYKELSHAEIIPHKGSIWFINREKQFWYFEFQNDGLLWWRFSYFSSFFSFFSLEPIEYRKIMTEWVEEVLNRKINSTRETNFSNSGGVEEILSGDVNKDKCRITNWNKETREILEYKVSHINPPLPTHNLKVNDVLKYSVETSMSKINDCLNNGIIDEVLNHSVTEEREIYYLNDSVVGEVLDIK